MNIRSRVLFLSSIVVLLLLLIIPAFASTPAGSASLPPMPSVLQPQCTKHVAIVAVDSGLGPSFVIAYNLQTGHKVWTYTDANSTFALDDRVLVAGNFIIIPTFYHTPNRSAATLLRSDTGVHAGTIYAEKGVSLDVAATPHIILLVSNDSGRSDNRAQLIAYSSITRKPVWQRKLAQSYCYEISIEPNAFALLLAVGRIKGSFGEPARYEVLRLSTGGGKVLSHKIVSKPRFNGVPRDVTKPLHAWFSGKLMANGGIYLERTTLVKQAGVVYVGIEASDSSDSAIYAVSERTGKQLWRYPLFGVKGFALQGTTLIATYQRSPWEMDESVRSAQGMIGLIALDIRTRQKLWEKTVLGGPM